MTFRFFNNGEISFSFVEFFITEICNRTHEKVSSMSEVCLESDYCAQSLLLITVPHIYFNMLWQNGKFCLPKTSNLEKTSDQIP